MKSTNIQDALLQLILKHRDAFEASVERRMSTSTYNKLGHQFVLETIPAKGEEASRVFINNLFAYDYLKPLDGVICCMNIDEVGFNDRSSMHGLVEILRFGG